jgi:hypothetical protein
LKTPLFKGCCTAIVTPFSERGIDYGQLENNLNYQYENGVSAVVVAGTTGEMATLSGEEYRELLRKSVQCCHGRLTVIAGIGSNNTMTALKNAEFVRYGVMHRNTYLNSPRLLDRYYRLRSDPRISFAGQMTGVEGYVESAASGMLVGIETAARILGLPAVDFPQETAIGALGLYVSGGSVGDFQPMNINFGIITPLDHRVKGKRNKNAEISKRSLEIIEKLKEKEVFRIEDHH